VVILTSVKEIWLNAALQGVYLWAQDQEYASTVYAICLSVCHTLVFCQNGPTKGHANNTAEQSRDSCFLIQRFWLNLNCVTLKGATDEGGVGYKKAHS